MTASATMTTKPASTSGSTLINIGLNPAGSGGIGSDWIGRPSEPSGIWKVASFWYGVTNTIAA